MIVAQPEKAHAIDFATAVLQEMHSFGQILNTAGISKAQVMIARHKNLMDIRQFGKPIQKIELFLFRSGLRKVAAMNNYIGSRQICQLPMQAMCIGYLQYLHRSTIPDNRRAVL